MSTLLLSVSAHVSHVQAEKRGQWLVEQTCTTDQWSVQENTLNVLMDAAAVQVGLFLFL